jgi:hypothetical protein
LNTAAPSEAPGEAVVADYLANRLSEAEAHSFEHYCLEHPDFAREVERELALKTGMRQAQAGARQVSASMSPKRQLSRWPLALAASVVVLASAVLIIQYVMDKQPQLVAFTSTTDVPDRLKRSAVSQVWLVRVRGNSATTQVSAPVDGVVEIRLLPDLDSKSGDYSVQISAQSPSSTKPLTVRHLRPAADGYLQLYVPASQIVGRTWLISVAEDGDSGKAQSHAVFRVQFVTAAGPAH